MMCSNCLSEAVAPEGPDGEKVCNKCGLVLNHTPIRTQSFSQWNPEWHSNWHDEDSETLKEWLTTLRTVSCQLQLPNFPYREEAARTIRKQNHLLFQSQKFGKNKRATIAALIHLILKEYGKTRPLKEIAQQLSLDTTLVMKQAWNLSRTINSEKNVLKIERKNSKDHLFEQGSKIIRDNSLLIEAEETLKKLRRPGGNPRALAAGALYNACKNQKVKVSKEQIGVAFGISHRTVYTNEAKIRILLKCQNIPQKQTSLTQELQLVTVQTRN